MNHKKKMSRRIWSQSSARDDISFEEEGCPAFQLKKSLKMLI